MAAKVAPVRATPDDGGVEVAKPTGMVTSSRGAAAPSGCMGAVKEWLRKLDIMDVLLDPYVKITLLPWKLAKSTKHLSNVTHVARFNEQLVYQVPAERPAGKPVKLFVEVWDWDAGSADDLIGFASIDISSAIATADATAEPQDHVVDLTDDDDNNCGQVFLRVQHAAGSGELQVFVRKAEGLKEHSKDVTSVEQDKFMWAKAILAVVFYMLLAGVFYTNVECSFDVFDYPSGSVFPDDCKDSSGVEQYWTWVDAVYYAVATLTTVGYGDLYPRTRSGKIFTCFFVYMGIGMIAAALSYLLNVMMESNGNSARDKMAMELDQEEQAALRKRKRIRKWVTSFALILGTTLIGAIFLYLHESKGWHTDENGNVTKSDGRRFLDSFYVACITMTSVGYGDYSPSTQSGRTFAIFWILGGTLVVAKGAGDLAETFITAKQDALDERQKKKALKTNDLMKIDADQSGEISELEYIRFMLMKLRKLDTFTSELLDQRFREIDVDGSGTITAEDVRLRDEKRAQVANKAKRRHSVQQQQ